MRFNQQNERLLAEQKYGKQQHYEEITKPTFRKILVFFLVAFFGMLFLLLGIPYILTLLV